jgi:hypothetical protein
VVDENSSRRDARFYVLPEITLEVLDDLRRDQFGLAAAGVLQ